MKKVKFPKQLFVAAEPPWKKGEDWFYSAGPKISDLHGFIDKEGKLQVATYELVEVKMLQLEEQK